MFTSTYLPFVGGVSRSVRSFAQDLRRDGHRVLVVAPACGAGGRSGGAGAEDDPEIQRTPAIQHFNGSDFALSLPIPFLLSERVRKFGPQILHSHPYLLGDTALRTARRHLVPLVFTQSRAESRGAQALACGGAGDGGAVLARAGPHETARRIRRGLARLPGTGARARD